MLNMRMKICCQVYRADSYEPDGRPGQVGLKMLVFFVFANFIITCLELLPRFEWPNGDKYIGQYINGKRNGLGDMQVLNWSYSVIIQYIRAHSTWIFSVWGWG